jgi:hypothetical protein
VRESKLATNAEHNKPSVLGFHHSRSLDCEPKLPEFVPPTFDNVPVKRLLDIEKFESLKPEDARDESHKDALRGPKDITYWVLKVVDKFVGHFLENSNKIPLTIKAMLKIVIN